MAEPDSPADDPGGPAEPGIDPADRWTSTVVLGNGDTALIRPISPADSDALRAFHERQSNESRYRRYFSPKPTLSDTEVAHFTTIDFVDRVAFAVEDRGEFVAWASYERWKHRTDAEVAFMVDDQYHGRGIATLLLEHLAAVARHNGISRFTAQTLADSRAMLAVFTKAGWPLQRRFESGVVDVDFALDDTSDFIDSVERREQRADSRAIARLLLPSSIAVIGASDADGSVGAELWRNVVASAHCPVHAVNPTRSSLDGYPVYPTVTDVPDEVALAVIAVPADQLDTVIDQCIAKRVRGAVVTTVVDAGFDSRGLVARARRNGMRIVGPASMGIAAPDPEIGLGASLVDIRPLATGRVAVSMQSGTLGSSLIRLAHSLDLGLSWFVSLGDKQDVSANDLLQFWEDDDATAVIALYTESFGNARKFARIARRVAARKPIVAVRTGAAMVGVAADALYRQSGVIEVPTVPALLDTARVLATQPLPAGCRVGVLSNARSPSVAACATLEAAGLTVAPTPPLDWRATPDDYRAALTAALADDAVDAVLVLHAPPVQDAIGTPATAIDEAAASAAKPVVAVVLGAGDGPILPGSPVPDFAFPEQAAAAIGRIAIYADWRRDEEQEPRAVAAPARIDAAAAGRIITRHVDLGTIDPLETRALLAAYGVEMPVGELVAIDDAPDTADRIGYPVAVKARRRQPGRSAKAGVALDLADRAAVDAALATMRTHLGNAAAEVLVQAMVPPGVDVRVRLTADERIGPVVAVGLGGVHADAIGDVSSRLAPVSLSTAEAMVADSRAAAVLDDDDTDVLTDLIVRVAQIASDHPELADLDLNPVIVSNGSCAVADATVALRRPDRPERAVRRLE